jgi:hypothetical protein
VDAIWGSWNMVAKLAGLNTPNIFKNK